MIPTLQASDVPRVTTSQMIEVDRAMVEDFHIDLVQMMENAGRSLALVARERFLGSDARGRRVVVLAGTGGNGGGVLVAARRLHNYGAIVEVFPSQADDRFTPVPGQQLDILRQMGVSIATDGISELAEAADLVLDGIIGYSLSGAPHGAPRNMIRLAMAQPSPILSLDVPSGVDTTTGIAHDPAIRATATLTLALPKAGLFAAGVQSHVGELYLADISVPPELYVESLGITVGSIFAASDVVKLV